MCDKSSVDSLEGAAGCAAANEAEENRAKPTIPIARFIMPNCYFKRRAKPLLSPLNRERTTRGLGK